IYLQRATCFTLNNKKTLRPSGAYHQINSIKVARGFAPSQQKHVSPLRGYHQTSSIKVARGFTPSQQKHLSPLRGCRYHTSLGEAKYKHVRGGKAPRTRKLLKTKKIYAPPGLWISY